MDSNKQHWYNYLVFKNLSFKIPLYIMYTRKALHEINISMFKRKNPQQNPNLKNSHLEVLEKNPKNKWIGLENHCKHNKSTKPF